MSTLDFQIRRPAALGSAFAEHLREAAGRYFPEFGEGEVGVRLVSERRRAQSRLYCFELQGTNGARRVLVKVSPQPQRDAPGDGDRPQLAPLPEAHLGFKFEHAALAAIQDHFDRLDDPRLGAVPLLDVLPDQRAIVMEVVPGTNLRRLFGGAGRFSLARPAPHLEQAFEYAGAWLRAYQSCPPPAHAEARHRTRSEVVELTAELTCFLAAEAGQAAFFARVLARFAERARKVLPDSLPLGLAHGDFAMRNVLVGSALGQGRVTAIDTRARWQGPIYEDPAYFLVDLRTNGLQVITQGLAFPPRLLASLEQAFLRGYQGSEPVCSEAIRLYQVPVLLDRWAVRVCDLRRKAAMPLVKHIGRWPVTRLGLALANRCFRRAMEELLL